jgi:hypothetical protein
MAATIIYRDKPAYAPGATGDQGDLWLPLPELTAATGWEIKPEGACLGAICVPIPARERREFLRDDDRQVNLAALARRLGQPVVHDASQSTWVFGETAGARHDALVSLEAPDFSLPDLDGRLHSLSDHRGRKVLLVTWASW